MFGGVPIAGNSRTFSMRSKVPVAKTPSRLVWFFVAGTDEVETLRSENIPAPIDATCAILYYSIVIK
jgi:hypothetical protein